MSVEVDTQTQLACAPEYEAFLASRHAELFERLEAAAKRSGRNAQDVTLIAVSKTVDTPAVLGAMRAGYTAFGENRPQELARKLSAFEAAGIEAPRFDMIGNLQKNKINTVLGRAHMIHSISSERLAQDVSLRAERTGKPVKVLLECNVSGEATKSGFAPKEVLEAAERLASLDYLDIQGLMTMAPAHSSDAARATFIGLRELAEALRARTSLALPVLSCGMSDDFEIAVEEGSTLVRLGRVVFSKDYDLQ